MAQGLTHHLPPLPSISLSPLDSYQKTERASFFLDTRRKRTSPFQLFGGYYGLDLLYIYPKPYKE